MLTYPLSDLVVMMTFQMRGGGCCIECIVYHDNVSSVLHPHAGPSLCFGDCLDSLSVLNSKSLPGFVHTAHRPSYHWWVHPPRQKTCGHHVFVSILQATLLLLSLAFRHTELLARIYQLQPNLQEDKDTSGKNQKTHPLAVAVLSVTPPYGNAICPHQYNIRIHNT